MGAHVFTPAARPQVERVAQFRARIEELEAQLTRVRTPKAPCMGLPHVARLL